MSHGSLEQHPAIIKRLNRASGHLRRVVAMIEDDQPCLDVAQQLQAVESAIASAKKAFINDHIDHCLLHAEEGSGPATAIAEFRAISRYL